MCIFDTYDQEILEAKHDLFKEGSNNYGKYWRMMSNNSVMFFEKPSKEKLMKLAEKIKNSGEPIPINRAVYL